MSNTIIRFLVISVFLVMNSHISYALRPVATIKGAPEEMRADIEGNTLRATESSFVSNHTSNLYQKAMALFRAKIEEDPELKLEWFALCGSFAKGRVQTGSDIDILFTLYMEGNFCNTVHKRPEEEMDRYYELSSRAREIVEGLNIQLRHAIKIDLHCGASLSFGPIYHTNLAGIERRDYNGSIAIDSDSGVSNKRLLAALSDYTYKFDTGREKTGSEYEGSQYGRTETMSIYMIGDAFEVTLKAMDYTEKEICRRSEKPQQEEEDIGPLIAKLVEFSKLHIKIGGWKLIEDPDPLIGANTAYDTRHDCAEPVRKKARAVLARLQSQYPIVKKSLVDNRIKLNSTCQHLAKGYQDALNEFVGCLREKSPNAVEFCFLFGGMVTSEGQYGESSMDIYFSPSYKIFDTESERMYRQIVEIGQTVARKYNIEFNFRYSRESYLSKLSCSYIEMRKITELEGNRLLMLRKAIDMGYWDKVAFAKLSSSSMLDIFDEIRINTLIDSCA